MASPTNGNAFAANDNAFATNDNALTTNDSAFAPIQVQVPTFVGYEDYRKMVNHYEIKCNRHNQQITEWTNKYTELQDKYQKLVMVTSDLQTKLNTNKQQLVEQLEQQKTLTDLNKEHQFLQKRYFETEQELKKISRLYRNIIPEKLCEGNDRESPTSHHRKKAYDYINIILFNQAKYYFHYDAIVDLFDDIIVALPENTTNERLPGCCCRGKYCKARCGVKKKRKRDRDYYHEYQPKRQKIMTNTSTSLPPPPPPPLQPINITSTRNRNVYDSNNGNDSKNKETTVSSSPVFDGFIIDEDVNEGND